MPKTHSFSSLANILVQSCPSDPAGCLYLANAKLLCCTLRCIYVIMPTNENISVGGLFMSDLRGNLNFLRLEHGIIQKIFYSTEECKNFKKLQKENDHLPIGVFKDSDSGKYYKLIKTDLTDQEINELINYRQTSCLYSIKYGVTFFVVLTAISLVIVLINLLIAMM